MNNGAYRPIRKPIIEINTLEQLMEFARDVKEELIIREQTNTIFIYDYYIE